MVFIYGICIYINIYIYPYLCKHIHISIKRRAAHVIHMQRTRMVVLNSKSPQSLLVSGIYHIRPTRTAPTGNRTHMINPRVYDMQSCICYIVSHYVARSCSTLTRARFRTIIPYVSPYLTIGSTWCLWQILCHPRYSVDLHHGDNWSELFHSQYHRIFTILWLITFLITWHVS